MARSSRWKDAGSQAQTPAAAPVADAPAAGATQGPPPAPPTAPPAPPFAPPVTAQPQAQGQAPGDAQAPPTNPFSPPQVAPSAPSAAAPPVPAGAPAAAPAGPAEGEVAQLRSTLQQLQATVAGLVERTQLATPPGGTPATDQASRIIVMANRAAESTMDEARAEAAEIVERARAHSVEIIATARELADRELAAERARVAAATTAWTERRSEIAGRLGDLAAALAGYETGLSGTGDAVRAAAAELAAEQTELPVIEELPAPDPAAFVGAELPVPAVVADETVIDLTDDAPTEGEVTDELAASTRTSLFGAQAPPAEIPADATEAIPAVEAAEEGSAAEATEAPAESPTGTNLRPGLFGR